MAKVMYAFMFRYLTMGGGVRIGRILEDMDIFAVHLVFKHVENCVDSSLCKFSDHFAIVTSRTCAALPQSVVLKLSHKDCPVHLLFKGTWCSGITSASHAEGPGFKSQCVHFHLCRQSS